MQLINIRYVYKITRGQGRGVNANVIIIKRLLSQQLFS